MIQDVLEITYDSDRSIRYFYQDAKNILLERSLQMFRRSCSKSKWSSWPVDRRSIFTFSLSRSQISYFFLVTERWRRGKNLSSSSTLHSYVVLINCVVNNLISIGFSGNNNFDYQLFQYSFRGKSTRGWGVQFFR